jgi:hypothetical protein
MATGPKILAFAGSTRTHSFNKRLVRIAVASARAAGADVTLIDLRDFPLPLFDGDLESRDGLPSNGSVPGSPRAPDVVPGVQQFNHRGVEEHHRLGLPSLSW